MTEFYMKIAQINISRFFFGGGARASPLPPVSYAYAQESLI